MQHDLPALAQDLRRPRGDPRPLHHGDLMTEDPLDRAKRILDRLEADEPEMKKRIDAAFADMAEARADLREHLCGWALAEAAAVGGR